MKLPRQLAAVERKVNKHASVLGGAKVKPSSTFAMPMPWLEGDFTSWLSRLGDSPMTTVPTVSPGIF